MPGLDQFSAYAENFIREHDIPGCAVALAVGDGEILAAGYGFRDREKALPATAQTLFGIASVTKSFTAMAVARLNELGLLCYGDPVSEHLPGFSLPGGVNHGVTIAHLLTHTSGMPGLDALQISFRSHSSPDIAIPQPEPLAHTPINTYPELLDYIGDSSAQVLGEPGRYCNYSNEAYAVLGALVRKVSGQTYASFVRENFLRPLEMTSTTFSFEEMYEHDDVTTLYTRNADGTLHSSRRWPCAPACQAAGRLKSNASELVRAFQMYAQGGIWRGRRVLSAESVAAMLTPRFKYGLSDYYGYGITIRPDWQTLTLCSHGGAGKGISAHAGCVPEAAVAAVVLTNVDGAPAAELWQALINTGLGLPLATPRNSYVPGHWLEEEVTGLPGRYQSQEGNELEILWQGDKLLLQQRSQSAEVQRLAGDMGLVRLRGQRQELVFHRDKTGQVTGVNLGLRLLPRRVD